MAEDDSKELLMEQVDLKKTFIKLFSDVSEDNDIDIEKKQNFETNFNSVYDLLSKHLKVKPKLGLDSNHTNDIDERKHKFGTDQFGEEEVRPFYKFILESLQDPMLRVLMMALLISLGVGILKEGLATG